MDGQQKGFIWKEKAKKEGITKKRVNSREEDREDGGMMPVGEGGGLTCDEGEGTTLSH